MNSSSAYEYATAEDIQRLFASDMTDLFRLAFLLTADAENAERCIILTIHECLSNDAVFKEWVPVWTRNTIIQNAIGIVTGVREYSRDEARFRKPSIHGVRRSAVDTSDDSVGLLELSDFDRIVYVICVIERYSTRDCALFLGRSRQEVHAAQKRALAQIARYEQRWIPLSQDPSLTPYSRSIEGTTDLDSSCGSLMA
jgi:hypothetical protein